MNLRLAVALLLTLLPFITHGREKRPNFLFILVDDQAR
jgi:hypothetical protein